MEKNICRHCYGFTWLNAFCVRKGKPGAFPYFLPSVTVFHYSLIPGEAACFLVSLWPFFCSIHLFPASFRNTGRQMWWKQSQTEQESSLEQMFATCRLQSVRLKHFTLELHNLLCTSKRGINQINMPAKHQYVSMVIVSMNTCWCCQLA